MLALGSSLTRSPYGQRLRAGVTLIQNTVNPDDIDKDEPVDIGLVGKLTLEALLAAVRDRMGAEPRDARPVMTEIDRMRRDWPRSRWDR